MYRIKKLTLHLQIQFCMYKHLLFSIILILIFPAVSQSQSVTPPPLQIDRSNNTFTPTLVQKGFMQVESGLLAERTNGALSFNTPNILLKYGVNKNFEIRLGSALLWQEGPVSNLGVPPLFAGIKASLTNEKGIVPQISFLGELAFDEAATSLYKAKYLAPRFRFLFQHTLSKKFGLGYNLGMKWNGFGPEPIALYTVCGSYNATDKLCVFAEVFGEQQKYSAAAHYADAGIMILLSNNSIFDISGGLNFAGAAYPAIARYYFAALGYSFRFNTIKKVETIFVR